MSHNIRRRKTVFGAALLTLSLMASTSAVLAKGEVNLYSSRHYDTDERLYSDFEEQTGITINRIEGNADELIARMEAEGANSPADVLLTVDISRVVRAEEKGLLSSVDSAVLNARLPQHLRHPDGLWFGFSQRSRIFFYDKERVETPPATYADLAKPDYKGMICARSSTNTYQISLLSSIIAHNGEEAATSWAKAVRENMARAPQGGDTDQLRGIASGECGIAISNTYYFARAIRTDVKGLSASIDKIGWVFPDQSGNGAHMNISAGAVAANAPHRENAIKFLEYLTSDAAQQYFSAGNDEYPAVSGVALSPSVAKLGLFRQDAINLSTVANNAAKATEIFNAVGWE
ncbi:extracellular solute-binding protein [Pararhizobium sp. IMCC21322]|uniref:extracellular solute-binding protein n=1 Tax=Pararhizobium sp. IMCC21322 TaxID=3067903 RepID=UPI0027420EA6|nr:extracellular solute-binding protein [Pararhizobium sp. IMCC21322]